MFALFAFSWLLSAQAYPLLIDGVKQYSCEFLSSTPQTRHFYFTEAFRPEPIPYQPTNRFFCHDYKTFGVIDSFDYPRSGERGVFYLWSNQDIRFYDLNYDGEIDVNENLRRYGTVFGALYLSNTTAPTETAHITGYYSKFFLGSGPAPEAICPVQGQSEYDLYLDYVGGDTQGVYMAQRETLYQTNPHDGSQQCQFDDWLVVSEEQVSPHWFYIKNGVTIPARTAQQLRNNAIYFYYPYDSVTPLIRKNHQKRYKIVRPSEVTSCQKQLGFNPIPTTYPSHDRRFGCIPKF